MIAGVPRQIWSWRQSALATAVVVSPLVLVLLVRPESRSPVEASATMGLVSYPLMLAAATLVYFHWRMSGRPSAAWLIVALLAVGVIGTVHSIVVAGAPALSEREMGWGLLLMVPTSILLGLVVTFAEHRDLQHDPAVLGLGVGAAVDAGLVLVVAADPPRLSETTALAVTTVVAAVVGAVVCRLLHLRTVEPWVRVRLAGVVALLYVGQVSALGFGEPQLLATITVVCDVVGATVLCVTALALLHVSIREDGLALVSLQQHLHQAEDGIRLNQDQLHEIASSVAGIAGASQLMRHDDTLAAERREQLTAMMQDEIDRLSRMLAGADVTSSSTFCVDDVVQPLVVSHQARGHDVLWTPTHHRATARPDDVAEIVNILLDNAAVHGGPGTIQVEVRGDGAEVEVVVSDTGPGVGDELGERIFERGVRTPESSGQGIGLYVARELVADSGGSLALVTSSAPGATFVLRIPTAARSFAEPLT